MIKHDLTLYNSHQQFTYQELYLFFYQLSFMLRANIPIMTCFDLLLLMQTKPDMQQIIISLSQDLQAGKKLHSSLQRLNFDAFICHLIHIGESTGKLDIMLSKCTDYLLKKITLHKQIKKLLAYPIFIFIFACLITWIMLIFLVPQFKTIFSSTNVAMPFITKFVFKLSSLLHHYGLLGLLLIIFCLTSYYIKTKHTVSLSKFILSLPYIKRMQQLLLMSRFSYHLAILLESGVNLTDALQTIKQTINHTIFAEKITNVMLELNKGKTFYQSLQYDKFFPILLLHFVKIGEQTGMLDAMLKQIALLWEQEIETQLNLVLPLLEPLIMIVLGVLIGGIVIALYLPIFKLGSTL